MVLGSADGRGISVRTIVIITVSIILFMILVVFLLCFIKKRKQKQIQNNLAERYCKFIYFPSGTDLVIYPVYVYPEF